ncbi:MAG: phosphoribosylanthranilate isomerase [Planctomycetia bacterium]|nr:phosphoribosylanthranilate isomerase [Planctomycetia bacterium]
MAKVKICGLSRSEDIEFVNQTKPDYIGFVFAPKSRRYVTPEKALRLRHSLSDGIAPVGVFVNAEIDLIVELVERNVISYVQLHGVEDQCYVDALRSRATAPVIQAFRVDSAEDVQRAMQSYADYILFDNGSGGTGQTFDWSVTIDSKRPFFLAGGLDTSNLEEALKRFCPFAVDLSSGVETNGVKDFQKIQKVVDIVRRFDSTCKS